MIDVDLTVTVCAGCGISAGAGARLPRGWKRAPTTAWCATCLHARYLHRSVAVPIAGPVDATWPEFGAALRETWTQTTACANWIVTELYARDIRREAGAAKLPPMPKIYLYPEAREKFAGISPINLTALLQQVEQTYRRQRYELLWTGARSLAVHRYPVPAPIHAQAWRLDPPDAGGAIVAHVRLGDRWWGVRLRRGPHFYAQGQQLIALANGTAHTGAGAIFSIAAQASDHRHAERGRRVMVKFTGWFPRPTLREAEGQCVVTTTASDLCQIRIGTRVIATIHGDELRRVIRAYTIRRGRTRNDGAVFASDKSSRRIKSLCQEMAAHVATIAVRAGVATVQYEDEERGFCDPFPWTKFRLWLQSAVEGRGLQWVYASGARGEEEPDTARDRRIVQTGEEITNVGHR